MVIRQEIAVGVSRLAGEAKGASGQAKVDQIIAEWQATGQHMTQLARDMGKRDDKYYTGSATVRGNEAWLDGVVRRHGRIFLGS